MIKQVIVMRKDLKMRRGKEIAQGAHASMAWMAEKLRAAERLNHVPQLTQEQSDWLSGRYTKICVSVDSDSALMVVHEAARVAGLDVHLIIDAGLTEFGGTPTVTCLAIGPHDAERIDPITQHLRLY